MTAGDEVAALLADPDPEVRRLATRRLPELGAAVAAPLLVVALGDDEWRVRKEAAQNAARIQPRTEVVLALFGALADKERIGLRNSAVEALASFGADAVPAGVLALGRLDADGRKLVVEVLSLVPDARGAAALARCLEDPDPNVRAAAAEALARAARADEETAEAAAAALRVAASDPDAQTRLAALRSLAELGVDLDLATLEPHVADPLTRRAALLLLACSSAPSALPRIAVAIARSPLSDARAAAVALAGAVVGDLDDEARADAVSRAATELPPARERLRALAGSSEAPEVRGAAVLLLGLCRNPDDVQLIVDALGDDEIAERAETALRLFGDDVVTPLVSAAMTAPPEVRTTSLSMVPHTEGAADPEALLGLRAAARDPASDVAGAALRSLAHVGTEADLELAAELTAGPDPRLMQSARMALRGLGERFPEVARAFVALHAASADHALACCALVEVLAESSAEARGPTARALLGRAATHRDALVRRAAVEAFAAVGGDAAVDAATFALADEEPEVVLAALRALGRLGQAGTLADLVASTRTPTLAAQALRALAHADPLRAVAAARPLLRAADAQVASAAIEAVQTAGGEARAEALLVALGHADREIVKVALAALARSEGEEATTGLATCLVHEAPEVRRLAADLLGQVGGGEARSLLRARLDREGDAGVREAITRSLQRGGARRDA